MAWAAEFPYSTCFDILYFFTCTFLRRLPSEAHQVIMRDEQMAVAREHQAVLYLQAEELYLARKTRKNRPTGGH